MDYIARTLWVREYLTETGEEGKRGQEQCKEYKYTEGTYQVWENRRNKLLKSGNNLDKRELHFKTVQHKNTNELKHIL